MKQKRRTQARPRNIRPVFINGCIKTRPVFLNGCIKASVSKHVVHKVHLSTDGRKIMERTRMRLYRDRRKKRKNCLICM